MSYQKIKWTIVPTALPHVSKSCGKCGHNTLFINTEKFRINAHKKLIDIWMIYQCQHCKSSFNLALFERIKPYQLQAQLFDKFQRNDADLVWQYAFDHVSHKLQGVKLETQLVPYFVEGPTLPFGTTISLSLNNPHALPIRLDQVIHQKCDLSKTFIKTQLIATHMVQGIKINLKKTHATPEMSLILDTHFFQKG